MKLCVVHLHYAKKLGWIGHVAPPGEWKNYVTLFWCENLKRGHSYRGTVTGRILDLRKIGYEREIELNWLGKGSIFVASLSMIMDLVFRRCRELLGRLRLSRRRANYVVVGYEDLMAPL
jgi:hypothetical protein